MSRDEGAEGRGGKRRRGGKERRGRSAARRCHQYAQEACAHSTWPLQQLASSKRRSGNSSWRRSVQLPDCQQQQHLWQQKHPTATAAAAFVARCRLQHSWSSWQLVGVSVHAVGLTSTSCCQRALTFAPECSVASHTRAAAATGAADATDAGATLCLWQQQHRRNSCSDSTLCALLCSHNSRARC